MKNDINWQALKDLRTKFIGTPDQRRENYWNSELLQSYDQTFAQRIGWKWDAVLNDLSSQSWPQKPISRLVDFGCGTGIQTRRVIEHLQRLGQKVEKVLLIDQSVEACRFAEEKIKLVHADIDVEILVGNWPKDIAEKDLLILSHVANELSSTDLEKLGKLLSLCGQFIWVDAGNKEVSKKLIRERDLLLGTHTVVGPCTHFNACPLANHDADWCHFFAKPPQEAFTTAFWKKFSETCGVDLRSLPLSYLVVERNTAKQMSKDSISRLIGRPRELKGHSELLGCSDKGMNRLRLSKKKNKQLVKTLKRDCFRFEWPSSDNKVEN